MPKAGEPMSGVDLPPSPSLRFHPGVGFNTTRFCDLDDGIVGKSDPFIGDAHSTVRDGALAERRHLNLGEILKFRLLFSAGNLRHVRVPSGDMGTPICTYIQGLRAAISWSQQGQVVKKRSLASWQGGAPLSIRNNWGTFKVFHIDLLRRSLSNGRSRRRPRPRAARLRRKSTELRPGRRLHDSALSSRALRRNEIREAQRLWPGRCKNSLFLALEDNHPHLQGREEV